MPLDAVFIKEGKSIVYLAKGAGFEPQEVKTGIDNDNYVVVASGVEEGERVSLSDPTLAPSDQKQDQKIKEKVDAPPTARSE